MTSEKAIADDVLTSERILEVARQQVRRFGEAKTNVVDIARALGTSHTTIYRHFRSKAEVFDALVLAAMDDEVELARSFVDAKGPASKRLEGFLLALHRRKLERFTSDPENAQLYRRIIEDRPDMIQDYSVRMTDLIAAILKQGVSRKEYKIDNIEAAAAVVRDAVTVYVYPTHVQAAANAGYSMEPALKRLLSTLERAFRSGVVFGVNLAKDKREQARS